MALAMEGDFKRITSFMGKDSIDVDKVKETIDSYNNLFIEEKGGNLEVRRKQYMKMVNDFYDLVTHFYEYGWGQSFHFAPRHRFESFEASVSRLEFYVALKLKLDKGMRVLDVGCGIGGPARAIARFSQATIIGLNNNSYQLQRCRDITKEARLTNLEWLQGDFHHIPAADNSLDAGFSFEAIEHAPQKVVVYKELFRVLKPGACFADVEWVMTNKYDPNNKKHNDIKMGIMKGNGLPDIETVDEVLAQVKEAGFEIVWTEDMSLTGDPETPWYDSLQGKFTLTGFRHTRLGHWATYAMVSTLECFGVAPKGTVATSTMLMKTAVALVESGKLGIFSPDYLIVMRKPLEKKNN